MNPINKPTFTLRWPQIPLFKLGLVVCSGFILLSACTTTNNVGQNVPDTLVSTGDVSVDKQAQAFRAVQLWSKAYEADPKKVDNAVGYARSLSRIGSDTLATKTLAQSTVLHPKNTEIMRLQAKLLSKQELYGAALRQMQMAVKYSPNDWRVFNDIGNIHSKMGEKTLALDSFKRALKLSPNKPNYIACQNGRRANKQADESR